MLDTLRNVDATRTGLGLTPGATTGPLARMKTRTQLLAGIATLVLTACAPSTIVGPVRTPHGVEMQEIDVGSLYAIRRASGEIPCPEDQLAVEAMGAGGYRVDGCGVLMTYECIHTPRGGLCQTRERQAWVAAEQTTQTARSEAEPRATAVDDSLPRTTATADSSAATAAREAIRTRTASVLACMGSDAVALEVTWTAEGALDASLRGALRGTEEEACVRAAIADLTITAPGTPGRVLHAVQR